MRAPLIALVLAGCASGPPNPREIARSSELSAALADYRSRAVADDPCQLSTVASGPLPNMEGVWQASSMVTHSETDANVGLEGGRRLELADQRSHPDGEGWELVTQSNIDGDSSRSLEIALSGNRAGPRVVMWIVEQGKSGGCTFELVSVMEGYQRDPATSTWQLCVFSVVVRREGVNCGTEKWIRSLGTLIAR